MYFHHRRGTTLARGRLSSRLTADALLTVTELTLFVSDFAEFGLEAAVGTAVAVSAAVAVVTVTETVWQSNRELWSFPMDVVWRWVALIIIGCLIAECVARADEVSMLTPTDVSVEVFKIERNVDPYLPAIDSYSNQDEYWSHGGALRWDFEWIRWRSLALYWNNYSHFSSTNRQVRHVGWQWDLGAHLGEQVDVFYWHHSQHVLDESAPEAYPLVDRYGVRFHLVN